MKAIGGGQSTNFTPEAINDNGWITGTLRSAAGNGYDNAVLYINGQFITLGTPQGFLGSEGVSISSIGIVAGNLLGTITYSGGTYTGVTGGFVYDGKVRNLNDLLDGNWQIVSVGHVNDFRTNSRYWYDARLNGDVCTFANPLVRFTQIAL